jgi:adenosine deaminase
MRFGWFTRNRKGTDEKRCRLKVPFIISRLEGDSLRPRGTRVPRLTRRAMASAEGEWAEYFRTSALVYEAVECLDRIGGLDDPPGAPRLYDAEDEHVFGMALRYHAAHVAKRVAAARRETAAAAVSDGGGGARSRDGVSLGRRLGYLPRQLDEVELDHGRHVAPSNGAAVVDDDDDARVVALTRHMRQLPKLELHAHLNGCVRDSTLLDRAEAVSRAAEDDATEDAPAREEEAEEEEAGEDENDRTGANKTPKPPPKPTAPRPHRKTADVRALLAKPDGKGRPLQRCFDLFAAIHDLCTDHDSLRRIAAEATMDFARDGVVYLELRTTPKSVPSRNVTKASYCAAVLDGLALGKKLADDWRRSKRRAGGDDDEGGTSAANASSNSSSFESFAICARLILSVDRRETPEEAVKTVKLAAFLRDAGADVCGVDLSGNPALGHWKSFEPALRLARHLKLPVTLHCGEIEGTGTEEAAMIAFEPDRFGHCVHTSRDPERWLALRRSEIPIEICVSSNCVTDSVPRDESCDGSHASRARRHHVGQAHAVGHPLCICTDDPGVFETTLSREYALVAVAFDLSDDDVRELVTGTVRHAFMTDAHDDPFAERAMRVKRRVMRGAANWRGFPGGGRASARRRAIGGVASRLMRRIREVGSALTTSLSRSNSPVSSEKGIRYADDDDDDDDDYERTAFGLLASALVGGGVAAAACRLCVKL